MGNVGGVAFFAYLRNANCTKERLLMDACARFRLFFCFFCWAIAGLPAWADPVSPQSAREKAMAFYLKQSVPGTKAVQDFQLVYPVEHGHAKSEGGAGCYVFNVLPDAGFVIVSADDDLQSILAYSLTGGFEARDMPENLSFWIQSYENQVKAYQEAVRQGLLHAVEMADTLGAASVPVVAPLLENHPDGAILYDQGLPYNVLCPNPDSLEKPMVTGCVATSMAMIARYHEWPERSFGSVEYETRSLGIPIRHEFGEKAYDWEHMLTTYADSTGYTEEEAEAVATLMRDMGYAVRMDYGYDLSGAFSDFLMQAWAFHMGYSKKMRFLTRDLFADADWADVVRAELDEGRPLYYAGNGIGGGHAFVCDGYDDQGYFHFNWGWSGRGNGWYALNNLAPTDLGTGAGYGEYNNDQTIVSGIRPAQEGEEADLFIVNNSERWRCQEGLFDAEDRAMVSLGWASNCGVDTVDIRVGLTFWQDSVLCNAYVFDSALLPPMYGLYGNVISLNPLSLLEPGTYQMKLSVQEVGTDEWVDVVGSTRYKVDYTLIVGNACFWVGSSGIPEHMPVRHLEATVEEDRLLLAWSDPCVMQPDFYRVYLDDVVAAEPDSTSVLFTGMASGRYKVEVMAVYEGDVESDRVMKYVEIKDVANEPWAGGVLRVYPNPASGSFRVDVPAAGHLRLLDLAGRLMLEQDLPSAGIYTLEVQGQVAGLYLLEFSESGGARLSYHKILLK